MEQQTKMMLNMYSILISFIICAFLGGIYYGVLFQKYYMRVLNLEHSNKLNVSKLFYILPNLTQLITIIAINMLFNMLTVDSIIKVIELTLIVGLGIIVMTLSCISVNPLFPKPFRYILLNAPYFLLCTFITWFIAYKLMH
jgi:hypothetical protein